MAKTIILYDLKNKDTVQKTKTIKSLFGYTDKSNHCKYTYTRKGKLSKFKYEKLDKSVLIINSNNEQEITKILKEHEINLLALKIPQKKT